MGTWVRAAVVAILGAVVLTSPVWLAPARPFVAPLQAGLGGPDPPPPTEAPPARPTPSATPSPPAASPTPEPQTESPSTPDNTQTTPEQATPERPSAAELARRAAARAAAREKARKARAAAALARNEREARNNRRRREEAFLAVQTDIERSDAVVNGVTVAAQAADPNASVSSSGSGNGWGRIGFLLFLVLSVASALAAVLPYVARAHRATAPAGSHRMDAVIGLTRSHRAELVALSVGALLLGLLLLGMS